jgi:hypothetical protein
MHKYIKIISGPNVCHVNRRISHKLWLLFYYSVCNTVLCTGPAIISKLSLRKQKFRRPSRSLKTTVTFFYVRSPVRKVAVDVNNCLCVGRFYCFMFRLCTNSHHQAIKVLRKSCYVQHLILYTNYPCVVIST